MLGLIRGRLYYNLLNWYRVLAMLPGYRVNRRFMEQMMGVKEPLPEALAAEIARDISRGPALDAFYLARTIAGLVAQSLHPQPSHRRVLRAARSRAGPRRHRRWTSGASTSSSPTIAILRRQLLLDVGRAARQRLLRDDLLRPAAQPGGALVRRRRRHAAERSDRRRRRYGQRRAGRAHAADGAARRRASRLRRSSRRRQRCGDPGRNAGCPGVHQRVRSVSREVRRSHRQRIEARELDAARRSASALPRGGGTRAPGRGRRATSAHDTAGSAADRLRRNRDGGSPTRWLGHPVRRIVFALGAAARAAPRSRSREPATGADAPVRPRPPHLSRDRPPPAHRRSSSTIRGTSSLSRWTRCWRLPTAARRPTIFVRCCASRSASSPICRRTGAGRSVRDAWARLRGQRLPPRG